MTETLNTRLLDVVARRSDETAFVVKRAGRWRELSFGWALEQARATAFGLLALGCRRGDRVAILSENRPEWATTDFGAMAAGIVIVPLYTTLIPAQVAYILRDADTRVVLVSTPEHLKTVLAVRDRVPSLERIVIFDPDGTPEDDLVMSLDSLQALGTGRPVAGFERMARESRPEDVVTIVYTSGTTGDPKGVVLTHRGFIAEYEAVYPAFEGRAGDSLLSFLPLSHILQRVVDTFAFFFGFRIAYAESIEALADNLREIRPTHIVAVPRVYEKIHGRLHAGLQQASPLKRGLFHWALAVGRRRNACASAGRVPPLLALQHRVAHALVFARIHAATGGNIRFYVSTGAPLAKGLAEFFDAVGIRIIEAWGMTELTGAATANTRNDYRFGSVGKPGPGVELTIGPEGEILVRGAIVMKEYWRRPEATAETIDAEGWLHTGDVGHLDEDGFLYITDRIKELIVTAGGKNVAPQPLENALKTDRFVAQAMVVGDQRHFVTALVVPQAEVLASWAAEQSIGGDLAALCADPAVRAHYRAIIDRIMAGFSRYERVREFTLVPGEFTQEAGELTPTLKLKRRVLLARHADLIDRMYEGSAAAPGAGARLTV